MSNKNRKGDNCTKPEVTSSTTWPEVELSYKPVIARLSHNTGSRFIAQTGSEISKQTCGEFAIVTAASASSDRNRKKKTTSCHFEPLSSLWVLVQGVKHLAAKNLGISCTY